MLDLDGKVLGKAAYTHDSDTIYSTRISVGAGTAAFYAGKEVYVLTQ